MEIIDPAVKGTLNVLRSCAKVPSVKRAIITSSLASIMYSGKPVTPDVVIDETWFSDPIICENMEVCVFLSSHTRYVFCNKFPLLKMFILFANFHVFSIVVLFKPVLASLFLSARLSCSSSDWSCF